jgi:hypothetical protein
VNSDLEKLQDRLVSRLEDTIGLVYARFENPVLALHELRAETRMAGIRSEEILTFHDLRLDGLGKAGSLFQVRRLGEECE